MQKIVYIRQATQEGKTPCLIGGVCDLNYVGSKTRRGRVQEMGTISPTIQTEGIPSVLEDWMWEIEGEWYQIRIRKLTPKECWRLQAFGFLNEDGTWNDELFDEAEQVNSNTQLYKQAGNSITVEVLRRILSNLFAA